MKKIIKTKWSLGFSLLLVIGAVILIPVLGFNLGADYRTNTVIGLSFGQDVEFERVKSNASSVKAFERLEREGNTYNITYLDLSDAQYDKLKESFQEMDSGVSVERMIIHNVNNSVREALYYLPLLAIVLILIFWWLLKGTLVYVKVNLMIVILADILVANLLLVALLSILSQRVLFSQEIFSISIGLGVLILVYSFTIIEHLIKFLRSIPHTKFSQKLDRFADENWKAISFEHLFGLALLLPLAYFVASWEVVFLVGLFILLDLYIQVFLFRQLYGFFVALRNLSFKRFKWKRRREKK